MAMNESVGRSNAPQEAATKCGNVGLQAILSTVGLFLRRLSEFFQSAAWPH